MDKKQFEVHLCSEMYERATILIFDLWLLVSVVAADYFCVFYLYLTLLLSNYFLFISIHKALWPSHQDKQLLTNGTSKNAKNVGSKPATGS